MEKDIESPQLLGKFPASLSSVATSPNLPGCGVGGWGGGGVGGGGVVAGGKGGGRGRGGGKELLSSLPRIAF